ncbi:MAG: hypothetical protein ABIY70_19455 [Capsulimonas sp.]|uniref:hypothetical protein n=1 Tax=Capsulimonas sp. TaxID=2494211 RepID=UPI0032633CAA
MKMLPLMASLVTAALAVAAAPAAHAAATLDIYASRAPVAAAQVAEKYGVNIELRGEFRRRVTFHVGDADSPGARLDAVNTLANALNADFVKMYVVTKSDGDAPVQALVDATARVPFTQTSLSAAEAVARIADADYALARIDGALDGSVTLSASKLTVAKAMSEIAAQTHTNWKTVYILTPRGAQSAAPRPAPPFCKWRRSSTTTRPAMPVRPSQERTHASRPSSSGSRPLPHRSKPLPSRPPAIQSQTAQRQTEIRPLDMELIHSSIPTTLRIPIPAPTMRAAARSFSAPRTRTVRFILGLADSRNRNRLGEKSLSQAKVTDAA